MMKVIAFENCNVLPLIDFIVAYTADLFGEVLIDILWILLRNIVF